MVVGFYIFLVFQFLDTEITSLPTTPCFAPFNWQDCGRPAQPVMYYWHSGSRCEVGLWRGCLPNINMFKDEYECVTTCIFSPRAGADDYHNLNEISGEIDYMEDEDLDVSETPDGGNETESNNETSDTDSNATDADTDSQNSTQDDNSTADDSGNGTNTDDGGKDGSDKPDGDGSDKPDGGASDKPDGAASDKPDGAASDKPDGAASDKPDGDGSSTTPKPDE